MNAQGLPGPHDRDSEYRYLLQRLWEHLAGTVTDKSVSISQLESIESIPNRDKLLKEAIMVRLDTRDGLHKQSLSR
jgi:hypothetical protein